jgi:histone deacetylase 11
VPTRLVYSPDYDLSLPGVDWLHPFDGRKYSQAWALVEAALGAGLAGLWDRPAAAVSQEALLLVHAREYLAALGSSSAVIARALELPLLRLLPRRLLESRLLRPMRLAVAGTLRAAEAALGGGTAMNFGGGFHHAFADRGEGFCLYADVALAIALHRAEGRLGRDEAVLVVDLDAHRGNGFFAVAGGDPAVHILDIYNAQRYPGLFPGDLDDFPFQVPLRAGIGDEVYLNTLEEELPRFLDSVWTPRLAFYNAGTDIVAGDKLGGFAVSYDGVAARDRAVVDALAVRGIPTVVVTSGGYSSLSHRLIADLAIHLAKRPA